MAGSLVCWNCGEPLEGIPLPISRHANCESCFEVLHCCRMCRHYRPDARPDCDHDRADPPVEKESANFCEYFKPANRFSAEGAGRASAAKSDLDALFGNESVEADAPGRGADPDDPVNKLKDLFDD